MRNEMLRKIKEDWFKTHKATYTVINDDLKILEWKKPDSLHMNIRYVMDKNNLYITGDLYSATLRLTEQANLESLGRYDAYYFNQKLVMAEQELNEFDSDLAVKELKDNFKDWYSVNIETEDEDLEEYRDMLKFLIGIAESSSDKEAWKEAVVFNYHDIDEVCCDSAEWIFNIGLRPTEYTSAYLIGLQMAYEQIFGKTDC